MANKYIIHNPSVASKERAKRQYFNALRRFSKHYIKSQENLLSEFFHSIQEFFATIGRPKLNKQDLVSPESPPDSDKYNDTIQALSDDMQIAYAEQNALEDGLLSHFNYNQTERLRLENILKDTRSKIDTYVIISKSREAKEIWIKDSFYTTEKIDTESTTSADRCHINTDGGYITLPRLKASSTWTTHEDIKTIRIETPNVPKESTFDSSEIDNTRIVAQGTTLDTIVEDRRSTNWEDHYQGKMYGTITQNGSILGEDGIRTDDVAIGGLQTSPLLKVLFPNDQKNVDTFWEYELVVLEGKVGQWTEIAPTDEIIDQYTGNTRRVLGEELKSGFITVDPKLEYSSGKSTDNYVWSQACRPDANTNFSLEITLIITLKVEQRMSEITLNPHTFGKKVYPIVTDIATSNAESGIFESLPQFVQQNRGRLDDVSISKLDKNNISLSSNSHFTFPSRTVKTIKISLAQDTPYQVGYTMALASRNWKINYSEAEHSGVLYHHTQYVWVDLLGRRFMNSLTRNVSSTIRTGISGYEDFEAKFEKLTGVDLLTERPEPSVTE